MKYNNIGDCKSLNEFVEKKLKTFKSLKRDFSSLFAVMFSEEKNVIYEKNDGYKITKTTYGECKKNCERRAFALKNALEGAEYGSVVGIYLDNGIEWIEVFWATLICGFKPLLMNMRLDDETLNKTLNCTGAVAVISAGKKFGNRTILLEELYSETQYLSENFGEEILVMSSGTSRSVKISAYGAEEFLSSISNSFDIIRKNKLVKKHYKGELKLLAFLPFYHIFGLVAVYIWFAFFSRTFVALNDLSAETLLGTIRRHKVTHVFAVPLFWQTIYDEAIKTVRQRGDKTYKKFEKALKISNKLGNTVLGRAFSKIAFKEVRENLFGDSISFMITGGSMIDCKVLEFFNGIGYRLANGYGMTEIGITSLEISGKRKILNSGSIGKPFSSIEYKIEDGELYVKGDGIAKYVIEGGKKTARGDWFKTCDLAEERDGRYYILGRKDDLIVSVTGENLNPNLIEAKFEYSGIRGVALIRGENDKPVLLVSVGKYLSGEKVKEIDEYVRNRIAELNLSTLLQGIEIITDPLVKGDEIKLDRIRLSKEYKDGTLKKANMGEKNDEGEHSELENKIREFFATAVGKEVAEVGYKTDFFLDEGGTSLDYMAMMSLIKKEFGVEFPESDSELKSVEAISEYIKERL